MPEERRQSHIDLLNALNEANKNMTTHLDEKISSIEKDLDDVQETQERNKKEYNLKFDSLDKELINVKDQLSQIKNNELFHIRSQLQEINNSIIKAYTK